MSAAAPPASNNVPPAFSAQDASELAARRAAEARALAKITGWKPLTIWYTFWAALFAFGALSSLFDGKFGTFLLALVFTFLAGLYARYLYRGGRHRVWFIVF